MILIFYWRYYCSLLYWNERSFPIKLIEVSINMSNTTILPIYRPSISIRFLFNDFPEPSNLVVEMLI